MIKLLSLTLLFSLLTAGQAHAWDQWYLGLRGGFGGVGFEKTIELNGVDNVVNRSEAPGVFGISLETLMNDKWAFSIEHRRGFALGPFTMGMGVTDVAWRWYYMGLARMPVHTFGSDTIFKQGWSAYVGPSVGVASGTISREGQEFPEESASGVTFGIRIGADYQYKSWMVLRPEIASSTSIMSSSIKPVTVSDFAIGVQMIIPFDKVTFWK